MNATVYLFGKFNQEYFQYPNDYTQEIFAKMSSYATAKTQICIHRQRELMYYAYIRRLDNTNSDYIGLCAVINDLFIDDIVALFDVFENIFSNIVLQGNILGFSDQAEVIVRMSPNSLKTEEINRIARWLEEGIRQIENRTRKLPPVSNGISPSEVKKFLLDDTNLDEDEVIDASWVYDYIFIFKDRDYDTSSFSNYKGVVERLNREKNEEIQKREKLFEEYKKVVKQKKQSNLVTLLSISLVVVFVGLLILNSKKMEQEDIISDKENTILAKDETILDKDNLIRVLSGRISSLRESKSELEQELLEQRQINSNWKYYSDSLWNANLIVKNELYYVRQQQKSLEKDNATLRQQLSSLQKSYNSVNQYESNTDYNVGNTTQSYRKAIIYSDAPLLERPKMNAPSILRNIGKNEVEIINRFNNDFYYVQVRNMRDKRGYFMRGYLWRGWIIKFVN